MYKRDELNVSSNFTNRLGYKDDDGRWAVVRRCEGAIGPPKKLSLVLRHGICEYVDPLRCKESANFVNPLGHECSGNDDEMREVGNLLLLTQVRPLPCHGLVRQEIGRLNEYLLT